MLEIVNNQALNKVTIIGKLLSGEFIDGETKDKRSYKRGNILVRVEQAFGRDPVDETSEVSVSFIAMKYKKDGGANPAYESVSQLQEMATAQAVGLANADRVKLGSGNIQENIFVPRGGSKEVSLWQLRGSFFQRAVAADNDCATFSADIFVLNMKSEMDRNSEETGRMLLRAALVQYGGKVDVIDFIVENPDVIEYIERNWSVGDTVNARGRIRFITKTEQVLSADTFGEEVPEQSTRTKKELIITSGSNFPKDEDFAYAPDDVKKGLLDRKARVEQLLEEARHAAGATPAARAAASSTAAKGANKSPYDWE